MWRPTFLVQPVRAIVRLVLPVLACLALVASCGGPTPPPDSVRDTPITEPVAASPREAAAPITDAQIAFADGDVAIRREERWFAADMGLELLPTDVIRTGVSSFCEVRIGDLALVRIQPQTEVSIDSLPNAGSPAHSTIGVTTGTVLSRVRALTGAEGFQVRTPTVTAGVRGTDFSVTARPDGGVTVAVASGAIALAPATMDLQRLRLAAIESADAQDVLDTVNATLPVVQAGNQVDLDGAQAEALGERGEPITALVAAAVAGEPVSADRDAASAAGAGVRNIVVSRPISTPAADALSTIRTREIVPAEPLPSAQPSREREPPPLPAGAVSARPADPAAAAPTPPAAAPTPAAAAPTPPAAAPAPQAAPTPAPAVSAPAPVAPAPAVPRATAAPAAPTAPTAPTPRAVAPLKPAPPARVSVTLQVAPGDAVVEINGRRAGAGSFTTDYAEGEVLSVTVRRAGFQTWTGTYAVGPDPLVVAAALEPAPVVGRHATDARNPTNTASGSGLIIIADAAGRIHAYDRSGVSVFTVSTQNAGEDGAVPVVADGLVYFSGTRELVIVDAASGSVRARVDLSPEQAQPFGMHGVRVARGFAYPTQSALFLLDPKTGAQLRRHPIPGGTGASPAVYQNRLLIVNRLGELLVVPADIGDPIDRIPTPTRNVTGVAPALHGSVAVFGDVRGTVVAVDVAASRLLWERSVGGRVFADATVTPTAAYVVSGSTLHALALGSGRDLFAPVQGVSGLPAAGGGYVFYGTDTGRLVAVHGTSGSVIGTVELDAPVRGRVHLDDRVLSVVTERGTLWRVHVDGMVGPR